MIPSQDQIDNKNQLQVAEIGEASKARTRRGKGDRKRLLTNNLAI